MYSIPIDEGFSIIPDGIDQDASQSAISTIEELMEGKIINGQRRNHLYGSKTFGRFGPFENNPLPTEFQRLVSSIISKQPELASYDWNQVEILKLSTGTKYFFDINSLQETVGPSLFVTVSGSVPIALHRKKRGETMNFHLEPDSSDQQNNIPAATTLSTSSLLLSPPAQSVTVFPPDFSQLYTAQIAAPSYRCKTLPISSAVPLAPCVYDFSSLLQIAYLKQQQKHLARRQWLDNQLAQGELTQERYEVLVEQDRSKHASWEVKMQKEMGAEAIADNKTAQEADSPVATPTPEQTSILNLEQTAEFLSVQPTIAVKRTDAYALIFRSFVKHTASLDQNNATDVSQSAQQRQRQNDTHSSETVQKNRTVPGVSLAIEAMSDAQLAAFERSHVHQVYDNIADHFSGTRYQAWPQVDQFLADLPQYTTLADVGCGNGKYLIAHRSKLVSTGCDISLNLLQHAASRQCEVAVGDSLSVPLRSSFFEATICIAVLHHIASVKRRVQALNELLRITQKHGQVLVTVWAQEQDGSGGRVFAQQDVWVPFKTSQSINDELQRQKAKRQEEQKQYQAQFRKKFELSAHTVSTQASTSPVPNESDVTQVPQSSNELAPVDSLIASGEVEAQSTRFYHVFAQGELEELFQHPDIRYPVQIDKVLYNKGNWCVIVTRLE